MKRILSAIVFFVIFYSYNIYAKSCLEAAVRSVYLNPSNLNVLSKPIYIDKLADLSAELRNSKIPIQKKTELSFQLFKEMGLNPVKKVISNGATKLTVIEIPDSEIARIYLRGSFKAMSTTKSAQTLSFVPKWSGSESIKGQFLNDTVLLGDDLISEMRFGGIGGTSSHEFRHAAFQQMRNEGIENIYHMEYRAVEEIGLDGNIPEKALSYSGYMSAEEIYNFAHAPFKESLTLSKKMSLVSKIKTLEEIDTYISQLGQLTNRNKRFAAMSDDIASAIDAKKIQEKIAANESLFTRHFAEGNFSFRTDQGYVLSIPMLSSQDKTYAKILAEFYKNKKMTTEVMDAQRHLMGKLKDNNDKIVTRMTLIEEKIKDVLPKHNLLRRKLSETLFKDRNPHLEYDLTPDEQALIAEIGQNLRELVQVAK